MNQISNIAESEYKKLRKAAILLASLDDALAERLLADLPEQEALAIRALMTELPDIEVAEHEAVVEDFRQEISTLPRSPAASLSTNFDGVELDASLLARLDNEVDTTTMPTGQTERLPWQALSLAETSLLVEVLAAESPQTIAVVLARLESPQAAELVSRLAPSLQTEVLTRLAELDPADEQALEVVESQLATWITNQRQRRERLSAGRDLVQRILQDTPAEHRQVLLARLDKRNPGLVENLSPRTAAPQPSAQHSLVPPASFFRPTPPASAPSVTEPRATEALRDLTSELESLDNPSLLRALQQADRETVLLALTGVSEKLIRRIVQGLPRRRAREFRQQIRAVGPARLSDILNAQRQLLRLSQA